MSMDIHKLMAFNVATKKKIKQREKREEEESNREQELKSVKKQELKKKILAIFADKKNTIIELKAEIEKVSQYGNHKHRDGIDNIINLAIDNATGKKTCLEVWGEMLKLSDKAAGMTDRIKKEKLDPLTGVCCPIDGIEYWKNEKLEYFTKAALKEKLNRRKKSFEKLKLKQKARLRTET